MIHLLMGKRYLDVPKLARNEFLIENSSNHLESIPDFFIRLLKIEGRPVYELIHFLK